MNIFASLITDMRQKKLWPIALLLVVLLVALPIALTKSSSPIAITPVTPAPNSSALPDVPSITAQVNPVHSALKGHKRNPFTPSVKAKTPAATASAGPTTATPSKPAGSSAGTQSSATQTTATHAATSPAVPTRPATTPSQPASPSVPVKPTKPPATTLRPTDVYDVSLAITDPAGGFNTIDSLERLSVIPNTRQPLLVELGVLKGAKRVLFAVQRGASLSGPGSCIPGPIDCELLALAPGQVEQLSGLTSGGLVYSEFAITRIHSRRLKSKAAARTARSRASSAGLNLLKGTTSSVRSLFPYDAKLGVILDRRNLGAGGN